ncbi:MAG: hypothetical protein P1U36_07480 [Legionellaceae bacterium]|nr:hypothetical protein [Legionellaceae bacterium]
MLNVNSFKRAIHEDIETLGGIEFDLKPNNKMNAEFKSIAWGIFFKVWIASMLPILMVYIKDFRELKNYIGGAVVHTLQYGGVNAVLTILLLIFTATSLYNYVYFNQRIKDELKLGGIINQVIKSSACLAYLTFLFILSLAADFYPIWASFAWPLALLPALAVAKVFLTVSNRRLGIIELTQNIKHSIKVRNNLNGLKKSWSS